VKEREKERKKEEWVSIFIHDHPTRFSAPSKKKRVLPTKDGYKKEALVGTVRLGRQKKNRRLGRIKTNEPPSWEPATPVANKQEGSLIKGGCGTPYILTVDS
jgi:hypothetical protein